MNATPPADTPPADRSSNADWNRLAAGAGCAVVGLLTIGMVVIVSIVLLFVGGRSTSERSEEPVRRDTAAPSGGSPNTRTLRQELPSRVGRFELGEVTSLPELRRENLTAKYSSPDGVQLTHQIVMFDSPARAIAEFESVASKMPAQGFEPESSTHRAFQDERGEQIAMSNTWSNRSSGAEIEMWTNGPAVAIVVGPQGVVRSFVTELPYYPSARPQTTGSNPAGAGDHTARWMPHSEGSGLECLNIKKGSEWLLGAYCRRWTTKPIEAEIYESTNLQIVVATDRYDDPTYLISVPSQQTFSRAYYVRRSDEAGYVTPIPPIGKPGEDNALIGHQDYIQRLEADLRKRRETNEAIMTALRSPSGSGFSTKNVEGLTASYSRNEALIESVNKELGEVEQRFKGLLERAGANGNQGAE